MQRNRLISWLVKIYCPSISIIKLDKYIISFICCIYIRCTYIYTYKYIHLFLLYVVYISGLFAIKYSRKFKKYLRETSLLFFPSTLYSPVFKVNIKYFVTCIDLLPEFSFIREQVVLKSISESGTEFQVQTYAHENIQCVSNCYVIDISYSL